MELRSPDQGFDESVAFPERVAASSERLRPAERKVARYLLDHMEEVVFASAEVIAAMIGTSDATVVRTAKSLGYSGLPELRRSLGATLAMRVRPSVILRQRIEKLDGSPAEAVDRIADEAIELIQESRRLLEHAPIADAVAVLAGAGDIVAYGYGPSGLSARYFELKLNRMGRSTRSLSSTGFSFADDLLRLRQNDVVVIFAPARALSELDVLVAHAKVVGARVMLITDSLGFRFASRIDVVLPAPFGVPGLTNPMIGELMAVDTLLVELAALDEQRTLASSDLLNQLRQTLIGGA